MGLQVRVRHALGERLIDLADRSAEYPLIVGRSKDADVKIPSVAVAVRHSALFVHEGQWVVQDLSKGATYLNGNSIKGPTPLSIGDVLTLGNDASPATIEVDPAGSAAGQTGDPAASTEPAPAREPQPRSVPMPRRAPAAAQGPSAAQTYAPPRAMPPQIAPVAQVPATDDPWAAMGATSDDPFAGWQQPGESSSGGQNPVTSRRRKKQSSAVGMTAGIVVCLLIVVGTIWAVYVETHPAAPPPVKVAAPAKDQHKALGNIFTGVDADPGPTAPKSIESHGGKTVAKPPRTPQNDSDATGSSAAPVAPPTDAPTASPSTPDASASGDDPKKDDKVWNDVVAATYAPDIGQAILKFDDYRRQHPGLATKELDDFTEQAMDRLWWQRIAQLCARRDGKTKELRAKDKELKEQPEGAFRKTLMDERKVIQEDLDRTQERLASDMGYTASDTPDLENKEMMTKLTGERDASKYGAWKLSTIKYIRNTHGTTPWQGEN